MTTRACKALCLVGAALCGLLGVGLGLACGAEGTAAPATILPDEDTGCESADDTFESTKALLASEALASVRPHIEAILVEGGGLRTVVAALTRVFQGAEPAAITATLDAAPDVDLDLLAPHVLEVLRYLRGTSPHLPGPHDEPLAAVAAILSSCNAAQVARGVSGLLELEMVGEGAEAQLVPRGTPGARSYLAALLLALADLTSDPLVIEALQDVEFEDDEQGGGVRIGRAAFQLIATVLAENIAAPDFELAPTRAILDAALASQLQAAPESAARLNTLLDLLELLVQPDSVVFENMQDIMRCLDEHDDGAAIPGMLYDWLTVEELAVEAFARDLQQTGAQPAMESLRLVAADALADLADSPGLITDLARVGARFLEPARAPAVIDLAFDVHARGVLEEVLRALGALGRCQVLRANDGADDDGAGVDDPGEPGENGDDP